jgi:hypothetical protein
MADPYDPLSYDNLARSVVGALLHNEPEPLPPAESFRGCGVYAIYYTGDLPYYAGVSATACDIPIYVGKAIPTGGRKGKRRPDTSETALYGRLRDHARSINQAENLSLGEFRCRYLVVVPVWITLAERFLVSHFQPLWNTTIDGFGNHAPGAGRKDMKRPRWDVVHPGRPWAGKLQAAETPAQITKLIKNAGT